MLADEKEEYHSKNVCNVNLECNQKIDTKKLMKIEELRKNRNSEYPDFLKVYFLNQRFYINNDFTEDATLGYTKDLTITLWSKKAEQIFGYKKEEILGRNLSLIVPEHKMSEIRNFLYKLENGDTIKSYDSIRIHKNGKLIPVGISNIPLYNDKGDFDGVFVQYRDITEKIRLQEQLEYTEELWRSAIRGGKFGVWEWNIESNTFRFHNKMYEPYGLNNGKKDKSFDDWLRFVHPEDVPKILSMLYNALQGTSYLCEFRTLDKDGQYIWVRGKGEVTEWDNNGNPIKMIGTNEDITDRKRIEEELAEKCRLLEKSQKEAELANQAKTKFLSLMSHEIRTPMNGILGLIHLLTKTKLDQKQAKWLNMLQESVDCQMMIINNMLDISRIEAGKIEPENNLFNLKTLVTEVFDQLSVLCKPKRLEARLYFDRDIKHMVIGDKYRVKQILLNLINNAAKFTDHGSVALEVRLLRSEESAECIEFKVIDTGIGISEGDKDKIFDSYFQGNLSAKKKHMGTGLGLSISKQLALMMEGDIEVDSIPGQGSAFRFVCKLSKYKKTERSSDIENQEEISTLQSVDLDISNGQNIVRDEIILCVEDNEINLEILEAIIKNYGFHLLTASSGEEALSLLEKYQVDIILMDIQMPVMSGYELTKLIRENERLKDIPIIAMTAHAMESDRKQCLDAGMNDFIPKPIDIKKLIGVISRYVD